MDGSFKSPRPPAPRRSRSRATSLSRVASNRGENIQEPTISSNNTSKLTASSLRSRLEGLLVAKSNEIVLAGRLGESLLNQQAELEARIRELENDGEGQQQHGANGVNGRERATTYEDSSDDDSTLGAEAREKLQTLENEVKRWERGNDEIYKVVGLPSGTSSELARQASHASLVSSATRSAQGR